VVPRVTGEARLADSPTCNVMCAASTAWPCSQ
jgi:hypothetical protein